MNETMPQDLGDGMMLVKIDFNEDGFVYVVECTGIPNVKLIKEHEKEIKHAMLENLKQSSRTNNETKALIEYCKKAHKTLSYKFIEKNNDEEVMITADPEEI